MLSISRLTQQFVTFSEMERMPSIQPLSPELQKIAIDELCEVPSMIPEDLRALKDWLATQPHLKVRSDDQFLVQVLRSCKYSLEKAKKKLDLYFSLKSKSPEMLHVTNADDVRFRTVSRLGNAVLLPHPKNATGPRILVFQFKYSPSEYVVDEVFQIFSAIHEMLVMHDPHACIHGIAYVVDYAKATAGHYLQLSTYFCMRLISYLEALPLIVKAIYYVNTSAAAQQFYKIILPIYSPQMREIVHLIGPNLEELYEHVPRDHLPRDLGGTLPSTVELAAEYDKVWDANREYFKQNALYGSNELLRPGKPLALNNLFGVSGSFRKLSLDL